MTQKAPERLFLYGTLAPGRENHHVVSGIEGTWATASVRGDLVEDGWGAAVGYPALIPRDGAPYVRGFVLSSSALQAHWSRLDAFEGKEYRRLTVRAYLDSGEQVPVQMYALADAPSGEGSR